MRNIYLIIVLYFILTISCSNPIGSPNEASNQFSFVADPQPVVEQIVETLEIGDKAPDFHLPATDGKYYSLSDFEKANVLVIVFTCNHCPTAQAYEDRLIKLVSDYTEHGVQFAAISPNSPLGLLYEELGYSDLNDDFEEMVIRAKKIKTSIFHTYMTEIHRKPQINMAPLLHHMFSFSIKRGN